VALPTANVSAIEARLAVARDVSQYNWGVPCERGLSRNRMGHMRTTTLWPAAVVTDKPLATADTGER